MNHGIPNRASDGGPDSGRSECESCGRLTSEHRMCTVKFCDTECCAACAVEGVEGVYCPKCQAVLAERTLMYPAYDVELGAPLCDQDTARWYAEAYRAGCGLAEAAAIENLATGKVN